MLCACIQCVVCVVYSRPSPCVSQSVCAAPSGLQVVQRSRPYRKESRKEAVREYFYGKLGGTAYFPFSFDVPFSEVQIYKIGGA